MNLKLASAIVVALGATVFAANSHAANTASAEGTGTVIQPIAVTKVADLSFGEFAPTGTAGTVTVNTAGTRSSDANVILSTVGSTISAAKFDVTGDANATYNITITPPTNLSDGATTPNTMGITLFSDLTASSATTTASGNVTNGTLDASGTQSIYVGGELAVGASQVAGTYTGTINVQVQYN